MTVQWTLTSAQQRPCIFTPSVCLSLCLSQRGYLNNIIVDKFREAVLVVLRHDVRKATHIRCCHNHGHAFLTSRVDYCNGVLHRASAASTGARVQQVGG